LVNVIDMISPGCTCRSASSQAMRWVSTRVLPEPAPATINRGDPACVTACRWRGLSPSKRAAPRFVVGVPEPSAGSSKRALIAETAYRRSPTAPGCGTLLACWIGGDFSTGTGHRCPWPADQPPRKPRSPRTPGLCRAGVCHEEETMSVTTPDSEIPAADEIPALREEIDRLDAEILRLIKRRSAVSQQIGRARMAAGGPRIVYNREMAVLDRFRDLGSEGRELGMILLRLGRGRLGGR